MKRAVIYIRVSTDEQADRGYSLGVQQEQLEKYCAAHEIEIVKLYSEDHSAKNFTRPEFNKFLNFAKTHHRELDYFLFVSWDRFSRNAPDAYQMIARLKKWGIEPQAITQPIDFSVPQSKIMLSIYLTLPEVDNDIRSEKVKSGLRGANKAGRWTTTAPFGYKNRRDEQNKPIIVPGETAPIVTWVFNELAKDERSLNDIRLEANRKGLNVSRSNFSHLVRNPVYTGKIRIKATEDEPEYTVEGLHEGIVPEHVFEKVQSVLSNREKKHKQNVRIKVIRDRDELPLRGLLSCSNCGKHVTGSASRSRSGDKHYYYHCAHCKQERYRADKADQEIEKLLAEIQVNEEITLLHDRIHEKEVQGTSTDNTQKRTALREQFAALEKRKQELQNQFLDQDIEISDYKELKERLDNRIYEVKAKLNDLSDQKQKLSQQISDTFKILPNIVEWYRNSGVQDKKQLLGSIFPEKLMFVKNKVRTTSIDEVLGLILKNTGRFDENKKGQKGYYPLLSYLVSPHGFKPE